ncbi:helix-turn-helix transcriptional regulator [Vibrio sp. 05-20-BW147]|uniref:helix-turn-helix domain-containing protein n=1 Tax=Vibrio sp. 05-20-BW147 TaxID=2575834 RepID=UPI001594159E|nr:helix-turn-helix transcriptional regulator [Vibrio sp. 05-20-BW147]NVC62024.1 helix-turn-helix transcriptional regulator [Vibrio sp. 05-20-BW147]
MQDTTPEYLLAALRQAIKSKGLTYRELSDRLGIPLSTFKRHLYSSNISLDKLLEYCRETDTSLEELQKLANQLKENDQNYFSQTQDDVFFEYPEIYDFYRELRHLRDKNGFNWMREKHGLDEATTRSYFHALELLGLIKLDEKYGFSLVGPMYYSFAEESKLNKKYTQILIEQTIAFPDCVKVGLSRMNLTDDQLKAVGKIVATEVLRYHSENMADGNFSVTDFKNVMLISSPHGSLMFSDGIGSLPQDVLEQIKDRIEQAGDKPSLAL